MVRADTRYPELCTVNHRHHFAHAHFIHRTVQLSDLVSWLRRPPTVSFPAGIATASFVQADSMSAAELQSAGPTGTKKVSNCFDLGTGSTSMLRAACGRAFAPDEHKDTQHAVRGICTAQAKKRRLDEACLEQHPQHSRNVIQSWITQGKVAINGRTITKAGSPVAADAQIVITAEIPKYVCR